MSPTCDCGAARPGISHLTHEPTQRSLRDCDRLLDTDTIHVHGGSGFTWEHQAHLYYRRAAPNAVLPGSAEEHRDRVDAMVLDDATSEKVPWVADGTAV